MLDATRTLLPELREGVRRIERSPAMAHGVLPFGVAAIDRALPGGGLARGALHEILGAGGDEEDGALAAAFAAWLLGRLGASPTSPSPSLTRRVPSPGASEMRHPTGARTRAPKGPLKGGE